MKWLDYKGLNHFLNKLKLLFIIKPKVGNDGDFLVKKGNLSEWKSIPNLLTFKGIVATYADLPTAANATVGDVWAVADLGGAEYYCSVDDLQIKFWDALGVHLGQYVEGDGIDIDIINHIIAVKYQGALEVDANGVLYVNPAKVIGEGQNISINQTSGILGTPSTISALGYKWDSTLQSFAEGSFAANVSSPASGSYSHAEGDSIVASGYASHAEGTSTTASNSNSHAEGNETTASGYASHAEGNSTTAPGPNSHAEGDGTTASGAYSHAEGQGTIVPMSGTFSWPTDGDYKILTYISQNPIVTGNILVYDGIYRRITDVETVAGGYKVTLDAAFNNETVSNVTLSYASGVAYADAAHVEGRNNTTTNEAEHAEGKYNLSISGSTIHTVGIGTSSARKNAHVITTDGKHYIPGVGTYAGTESSLPTGQDLASIINSKLDILSNGNNISVVNNTVNALGYTYNQSKNSFAVGNSSTASGQVSFAVGEGKALATSSYASGSGRAYKFCSNAEGAGTVCDAYNAHVEGEMSAVLYNSQGHSSGAHAEGNHTTASNTGAHSEGVHTLASGRGSHAEGGSEGAELSVGISFTNYTAVGDGGSPEKYYKFILTTASAWDIDNIAHFVIHFTSPATGDDCYWVKTISQTLLNNEYVTTVEVLDFGGKGSEVPTSTPNRIKVHYYTTMALGAYSHAEGRSTKTSNIAEHAEGKYNASHTGATSAEQTIHSVGIGTSTSARSNAIEVMSNGNVYITGLGGYNGDNPSAATRLQDLVVKADWNASGTPAEILNKPTNLAVSYLSADITSGTTTTITAATHLCGTFPVVQVYHGFNVIYPSISVNASGDVTVTWSGITVDAQTPIKIKIVG